MKAAFRYQYGQTVRVVASAPQTLKPGSHVDVVGMTKLNQEREVLGSPYPMGTNLYVIEYGDGSSIEVPEEFLKPN